MRLIDLTCPHCGASLKVDANKKQASCEHCGATFMIDDEAQHIIYDNAEQAGYDFEKGRQRAQRESPGSATEKKDYSAKQTPKQNNAPARQKTPVSPGRAPQKRSHLPWLLFIAACVLVMIPVVISYIRRSNAAKESAERAAEILSDESLQAEFEEYRITSMNGRGKADSGRSEPGYVGDTGYVAVYYSQESDIEKSDDFTNEDLWTVPTYEQDKQFWTETGTLPHKTEVTVLWQSLKHDGAGFYSGYLRVETTDDHSEYYIDVENFITKPYWTYSDLYEAAKVGPFVAEYKQVSDYWPVNSSGDKVEIPDGTKVLVKGLTGLSGKYNHNETDLTAVVWKEWKLGYGGMDCHFNHRDLTLIY